MPCLWPMNPLRFAFVSPHRRKLLRGVLFTFAVAAGLLAPVPAADASQTKKAKRARASLSETGRVRGRLAVSYPNCAAARAAGAAPIRIGDPGYSRKLDRDGDGVACE